MEEFNYNPIVVKRILNYISSPISKSTYTNKEKHCNYKIKTHKKYKSKIVQDIRRKLDLLYIYYTGKTNKYE